ncbi:acylneuraminate cytidylyltransferase family protein [Oceanobacillus kimchii]|uniref:acylneuraminate cytidylyltransferase family protein n=1 Tax=Oceanobacillus kimchii TaxID=746691 RepID=UPI000987691B|nr:acylneuraminate cytidylyltransferase family protein [Oceanobacillus kimchii]
MDKMIAIIPARSGSKGLPGKNVKDLNGKPMIAYTIEAALKTKKFDEVYVSTDSRVYADIALEYGAKVPFLRNNRLASDKASTWEVVKEVLNWYKQNQGKEYCKVCLLQPTSPLRDEKDIIKALELMEKKKARTVISVCPNDHPLHIVNTITSDLSLNNFMSNEVESKRRQELDQVYRINGAIYIRYVNDVLQNEPIYSSKSYAYIMSKLNSVDIDDYVDFLLADVLLQYKEDRYSD